METRPQSAMHQFWSAGLQCYYRDYCLGSAALVVDIAQDRHALVHHFPARGLALACGVHHSGKCCSTALTDAICGMALCLNAGALGISHTSSLAEIWAIRCILLKRVHRGPNLGLRLLSGLCARGVPGQAMRSESTLNGCEHIWRFL